MKVNKRLLAFFGEEEAVVWQGVHEEVLCEDGRAGCMAEDVEVGFDVRISIGVVCAETFSREMV